MLIPNGVSVRSFRERSRSRAGPGPGRALGFLGRIDEPRKGLQVLLAALPALAAEHPGLRLLVAGPGDIDEVRATIPPEHRDRVTFLGLVSEGDKARMLASVDAYVAPNTGGESFGIVLLEAMAAGAPVVASDLDAFRRVLADGPAARCSSTRTRPRSRRSLGSVLADRTSEPACARPAPRAWPATTGSAWRPRSSRSTRR